jgi:hypothetical protein
MVKKATKPEKEYRSFTIQGSSIGFQGGSYISTSPSGAAKKAAKQLFKLVEKEEEYKKYDDEKIIQFILRETTKGSKHKTYPYDGKKNKFPKPVELPIKDKNGNPLLVEYEFRAVPLKEHEVRSYLQEHLNNNV